MLRFALLFLAGLTVFLEELHRQVPRDCGLAPLYSRLPASWGMGKAWLYGSSCDKFGTRLGSSEIDQIFHLCCRIPLALFVL